MNKQATWYELPVEIQERMLECQVEQGNDKDASVFETNVNTAHPYGGFWWASTVEGIGFWNEVLNNSNFQLFFERYPQ